jgi:hypothetical protein
LQHYNIDSFVQALEESFASVRSNVNLYVQGHSPLVLSNAADGAQHCRTFWCAQVHPPLAHLVRLVDNVMQARNLPLFYESPVWHTSWASAPGDWTKTSLPTIPTFHQVFSLTHVTCRLGDKVFRIHLGTSAEDDDSSE